MGPAEERAPASLQKDGADAAQGPDADGAALAERTLPGLVRRALRRRRGAAAEAAPAAGAPDEVVAAPARARLSPVLTLAVLLLVAGAALGSWLALAGGVAVEPDSTRGGASPSPRNGWGRR
ncbi:hypothetical protein OG698_40915 [Streptomyces sp. NBC_01003]|uniref:hypothetical protein n=1 Tax=Streptomyces sp. NBC_01003 TaxID=2903714 RepID=UPI00386A59C6|nr:hypothetical protein OG698_40915 [Streptomyces sp. NBC_01003]